MPAMDYRQAPVNPRRTQAEPGWSAPSGGVQVAALVALAIVVFLLFPVRRRVEGTGIVRPLFEQLATLRPKATAFVTSVDTQALQKVEAGSTLFSMVGSRGERVGVRVAAAIGAGPAASGAEATPAADPVEERRLAIHTAYREWLGLAMKAGGTSWEQTLCTASWHRFDAIDEFERRQSSGAGLGSVDVWDPVAGRYIPASEGVPFPSDFAGTILGLWVTPGMQIGPTRPVAELMTEGTPLEVIGVVPAALRPALAGRELEATIPPGATALASRVLGVTEVRVGGATLQPAQVALLFPGITVSEPSVVVRLTLKSQVDPADVGRVARFEIAGGRRPRVWSWIAGGK